MSWRGSWKGWAEAGAGHEGRSKALPLHVILNEVKDLGGGALAPKRSRPQILRCAQDDNGRQWTKLKRHPFQGDRQGLPAS